MNTRADVGLKLFACFNAALGIALSVVCSILYYFIRRGIQYESGIVRRYGTNVNELKDIKAQPWYIWVMILSLSTSLVRGLKGKFTWHDGEEVRWL